MFQSWWDLVEMITGFIFVYLAAAIILGLIRRYLI